ncbi:MAG: oxidoreductase [Candidatus Taylorbacteria bacterium]|nr:oxidoreductase [Candidatus Taylorbacteria bacterium]
MESSKQAPILNIPVAIIVAGAIVAASVIWTKRPAPVASAKPVEQIVISIRPVSATDHILGSPNAPIKIVEYSDPSCPFCKIFHPVMQQLMSDYGKAGSVAWVYRSYPLDTPDPAGNILHKNAGHESQALECAAEVGGNDKFWAYTNRLYEITPSVTSTSPNGLDQNELPNIAKYVGIDVVKFNTCLASGRMAARVNADKTDGLNAGISGTPSSIIALNKPISSSVRDQVMKVYEPYRSQNGDYPVMFSDDGRFLSVNGALPLEVMKATIEILYANTK